MHGRAYSSRLLSQNSLLEQFCKLVVICSLRHLVVETWNDTLRKRRKQPNLLSLTSMDVPWAFHCSRVISTERDWPVESLRSLPMCYLLT